MISRCVSVALVVAFCSTVALVVRGEPDHALPEVRSVVNGTFEAGVDIEASGWSAWSRDDVLSATFSAEARAGERAVKLEYPDVQPRGYHDWTFENRGQLDVEPGEVWTASAWVRYEATQRIGLEILALGDGEPLSRWRSGYAAAYGSGDWERLQATATIPPDAEQIRVRFTGSGRTRAWIDDVRLREGEAERAGQPRPEVRGWAFDGERVRDRLGRGVVALPRDDGSVYVRWRLLQADAEDIAFNLYRMAADGDPRRLNSDPITTTTDFVDETADLAVSNAYYVRPVVDGREDEPSERFIVEADARIRPYISIPLDDDRTTFQKVGIGDLNGDGRYDFVIKTPDTNIDPFHRHWRPSTTTYKLEA